MMTGAGTCRCHVSRTPYARPTHPYDKNPDNDNNSNMPHPTPQTRPKYARSTPQERPTPYNTRIATHLPTLQLPDEGAREVLLGDGQHGGELEEAP